MWQGRGDRLRRWEEDRQTEREREMDERGDDGKKEQLCWETGGEEANKMAAGP